MSGLENMKRQILDEANHSAEEQISKARTKGGRDFKRSKRADGGTERSHG